MTPSERQEARAQVDALRELAALRLDFGRMPTAHSAALLDRALVLIERALRDGSLRRAVDSLDALDRAEAAKDIWYEMAAHLKAENARLRAAGDALANPRCDCRNHHKQDLDAWAALRQDARDV